MQLHLEPITPQNRTHALALALAPGQEGFVEPVSQCLAEADRRHFWRPVGIYDGSTLVGFAMYGLFRWESFPMGRVWLDRFFIDGRFQHKGYGRAALAALLEKLRLEYRRRRVYLSIIPGNDAASSLYTSVGFRFTGKQDLHGEQIMVYSFPAP